MQALLALAAEIGAQLKARGETIAIAESASGGLLSAALLAVPGASAFYLGGAVIYTRRARRVLLDLADRQVLGLRSETEAFALLMAQTQRTRFEASWALGETGAAGPSGSPYGDPPGRSCLAVAGPIERAITIETGSTDRFSNMQEFALAALSLLRDSMAEKTVTSAPA
jgi:nicotinamide-nucleotide amidase